MRLLCLLLFALPEGPYVRWIDQKGDVQALEVRAVLEESPSEVRVRLMDGSERTVAVARVIELVRENGEREEERTLLAARRDVATRVRPDAARKTLDRLARDGSEPWIREYAAATRALLAEQAGEEDAAAQLRRFLDEHPRSRFQSDCIVAEARILARAPGKGLPKALEALEAGRDRVKELGGPIALRARMLRDATELVLKVGIEEAPLMSSIRDRLLSETGEGSDYGAYLLIEAEVKWTMLLIQRRAADDELAKGRQPRAALREVKRLLLNSNLDLPEVRSDLERELGRLQLACEDKEGARGAFERARDLAPDPRRREAAEEALKKLAP